jgi:hypothetical protein
VRSRAVRHAAARAPGIGPARARRAHGRCARVRAACMWPACVRRSAVRDRPVRSGPVLIPAVWSGPIRVPAVRSAGVLVTAVRSAAVRVPATRARGHAASGHRAPWHAAAGHAAPGHPGVARIPVRRRTRNEAAWLARLGLAGLRLGRRRLGRRRLARLGLAGLGSSRLAGSRLVGRHLARAPQQLTVVVVLGLRTSARPGRIVLLGRVAVAGGMGRRAMAVAVPLVLGRTVRVTAEAGVATFHPIPPGPLCPASAAGHLPSPEECRSTEIPCMT